MADKSFASLVSKFAYDKGPSSSRSATLKSCCIHLTNVAEPDSAVRSSASLNDDNLERISDAHRSSPKRPKLVRYYFMLRSKLLCQTALNSKFGKYLG